MATSNERSARSARQKSKTTGKSAGGTSKARSSVKGGKKPTSAAKVGHKKKARRGPGPQASGPNGTADGQSASKASKASKAAAKAAAKTVKKTAVKAARKAAAVKKSAQKASKTASKTASKMASKTASKAAAKKTGQKAAKKTGGKARKKDRRSDVVAAAPELFSPLTEGEKADAVRLLTEDRRVANMSKVGRYRVIACEPLVVKPPHWMAGRRLARLVVYDYAGDRCVDACVDLDDGVVAHLGISRAQPMLSREEEAAAISIAIADGRVSEKLSLGDEPQLAMQYWAHRDTELAFARRSAAVIFGNGGHASVVAVVDLLDNIVTEIVPAAQW